MTDAFALDAQRRQAILDRVYAVRAALAECVDSEDGEAALAAIREMYALVDLIPDAQVLYVGAGEETKSFVLPAAARQMTARYYGSCSECGRPIRQGEIMYWVGESRSSICASCSMPDLMGAAK